MTTNNPNNAPSRDGERAVITVTRPAADGGATTAVYAVTDEQADLIEAVLTLTFDVPIERFVVSSAQDIELARVLHG